MLQQFQDYQEQQHFQLSERPSLIATSGGIDSVVLCYLYHQAQYPFAIAHCNFQLRARDSDEDEIFVKQLATFFGVPFYNITFETEKIAQQNKQSIQVAARELRYEWLQNIRQQHGFEYVVTAHHLNDSVETVLYNFTKGCGIRGLHGILPLQDSLIRPLLFATKLDIEAFAKKQNIAFREDVSNASDKYSRNKIRHHVVPVLEQINENFVQTASRTIKRLQETEALYDFAIDILKKQVLQIKGTQIQIDLNLLKKQPAATTVLYELLKPYQFHADQVTQILNDSHRQSGSQFFSKTHQAVIHQDHLFIEALQERQIQSSIKIKTPSQQIDLGQQILSLKMLDQKPTSFSPNKNIALFDASLLQFPLSLRHWKAGDYFQPIGMKGKHQKLQDYFSNQKLSRLDKEKVWILESAGKICWVVGFRMDERFKITAKTTQVLEIKLA